MDTMNYKSDSHLLVAENYYSAMLQKDFDAMASCLHSDVHFIGPLAEMHGKDLVVSAAKNLSQILQDIRIRASFEAHNQIMLSYDFMFPEPIGKLRAAVLMKFENQLISKIELFYDGRPFEEKKSEIFANQKR
jgi:SnoaL-like domain